MSDDRLQCLAIRQPWAWAGCVGAKNVENRVWTTEHRGPLAIQASAATQAVKALAKKSQGKLNAGDMPCGMILGVVDLVDIVPLGDIPADNLWATGPYCWKFANARLLHDPIAYKGALHLYELPVAITDDIRAQLNRKPPPRQQFADAWLAAIEPDSYDTNRERCSSYVELRDFAGIVRAATELIRLRPDSSEAFRIRGVGNFHDGDAPASVPDLLEAIRLDPDDVDAHLVLALAYQATGDNPKSAFHWNRAKELDPDTQPLD